MAPGKLDFSGGEFSFYESKEKEGCSEKRGLGLGADGAGVPVKGSSSRRACTHHCGGLALGLRSSTGAARGQGKGHGAPVNMAALRALTGR